MNQETIENEINTNGNRKIVVGVRCYSELKFKLLIEAQNLGIPLSEHCESILLNHENLVLEKHDLLHELETLKQELQNEVENSAKIESRYNLEIQKFKAENNRLTKDVDLIKQQTALFSNKQLLYLFEKIKGSNDIIDSPDGQKYHVTYNEPKDLLEAMIYSFNIQKP